MAQRILSTSGDASLVRRPAVNAADVDAAGDPQVGSLETNARLSNNVAQNRFTLDMELVPDFQMELERLAPGRVTVWNEAGSASRLLECSHSEHEEIDQAYQKLRNLVLAKLNRLDAQNVNFEFSYTRVSYHLSDGRKITKELDEILIKTRSAGGL